MRRLMLAAALAATAAPLAAQGDPDNKVVGAAGLPMGWVARLDRANAKTEDAKFVSMGPGFHATLGPAGIFYNPKDMANGNFVVTASMTQTKAPTHPEAYGLFVGGRNLDQPAQEYLYFIVRQDGKFAVKHRAGTEVHTIADWTEHAAITKADENGKATNLVAIKSTTDSIIYMVNGTQVYGQDRAHAAMGGTNGQAGLRVNHNLDVHIGDFAIVAAADGMRREKAKAPKATKATKISKDAKP